MHRLGHSPLRARERMVMASFGVLACFLLLSMRLWFLQLYSHEHYQQLSDNNQVRTVYLAPPRGLILSRTGEVLARNRPSFNIEFVAADSPNPSETIARTAKLLGRDPETLKLSVRKQRRRHKYEPAILVMDASRDDVARVLAQRYQLPGVLVDVVPTREYTGNERAAHLLGYTREVTSRQLAKPEFSEYRNGDIVGQSGVEAKFEDTLKGERGTQRVIVNASGVRIRALAPQKERIGNSVTLTIDLALQKAADDALADKKGALVVLDVRTGEILAMSSAPRFDPNVFTTEVPKDIWSQLMSPVEFRLTNRAIQGLYPPGSVFKIYMAVAALAEKVTTKDERIHCPGSFSVGKATFGCHKKTGHGAVNLREALIQSCDVYFYTIGQRLGIDRIHQYASLFGLGELTGIDLDQEKAGLVPSPEWKRRLAARAKEQGAKRALDGRWYVGETPSVVIGQGAVSLTPLQIARATAALVNGGRVLVPKIIRSESAGKSVAVVKRELQVNPEILNYVRDALVGVVYDPRGTGHKAQLGPGFEVKLGGKTGTAQPASLHLQDDAEHLNDHAWFSAFAPAEDPEIVVTALIENGGHGGVAAAPVVKQVMEEYFRNHNLEWVVANPVQVQEKRKPH